VLRSSGDVSEVRGRPPPCSCDGFALKMVCFELVRRLFRSARAGREEAAGAGEGLRPACADEVDLSLSVKCRRCASLAAENAEAVGVIEHVKQPAPRRWCELWHSAYMAAIE